MTFSAVFTGKTCTAIDMAAASSDARCNGRSAVRTVFHVTSKPITIIGKKTGNISSFNSSCRPANVRPNTDSAQRRFSANAAHQLRTPLAILRTRIDELPPTMAQAELRRDVDRMTRLVSQLLTAARLEAGQMGNFEEVDLTEFVRRILADITPLAHAADRDLELDSPGKVSAMVSASALEEAVRNLVDNALRHTPPGSTVSVSVRPGATIEVRDHGPGVPIDLREQVFEPFWSAARKSEGGAGLGLAIVREAVQLQDGFVEIADANGVPSGPRNPVAICLKCLNWWSAAG
jgi:signal transduction histidine kinase